MGGMSGEGVDGERKGRWWRRRELKSDRVRMWFVGEVEWNKSEWGMKMKGEGGWISEDGFGVLLDGKEGFVGFGVEMLHFDEYFGERKFGDYILLIII